MTDLTVSWPGASGNSYKYWGYPIGSSLKAEAGNYIFAKSLKPGFWTAVYIGECEDLSGRFDDHHQMDCILRNGATHVFAHLTPGARQVRLDEETDLRHNFNTTCNVQ